MQAEEGHVCWPTAEGIPEKENREFVENKLWRRPIPWHQTKSKPVFDTGMAEILETQECQVTVVASRVDTPDS